MMSWVDAVKKYASMKGTKFHIPKKGTEAYNEIKKLQASGKGGITPAKAKKMVADMNKPAKMPKKMAQASSSMSAAAAAVGAGAGEDMSASMKKMRKMRSDKGKARGPSTKRIAEESVKQKLVSKAVAFGRKPRSDKGKKRGARARPTTYTDVDDVD